MFKFEVGDMVRVVSPISVLAAQFIGIEAPVLKAILHNGKNVYETIVFSFFEDELELVQPAMQVSSTDLSDALAYSMFCGDGTINIRTDSNKKCECGSHAVGVDRHSDYCPLYSKD